MGNIFGTANKSLDVIDQLVVDKDKANELKAQFYLAELQTKTIPIIDGIHKLGRQTLAFAQIGFYMWAVQKGVDITPELVAGVSGVSGAYTLAKGRGK
ncbi:hypothetical protein [Reinekea thalattae]|uniref:Uncharacterized protein n=1 Tax=Reinekea thalattae TaxID=2593301 RepID=A0A5C8Z3E1_9GAMM|nr:hypothetical protein [Reinekea thalattae]TXR52067.1 hypothetical protein FME95_11670 [Reinekea thalattae]